jgi:hypothetical protein
VTVFYDPNAPDEAVLVPGSWRGRTMNGRVVLILFFAGLFAFSAWRLRRPPEADAAIGDPPPEAPPQV